MGCSHEGTIICRLLAVAAVVAAIAVLLGRGLMCWGPADAPDLSGEERFLESEAEYARKVKAERIGELRRSMDNKHDAATVSAPIAPAPRQHPE